MSNASPNTGHARYTVNPGVVTSRLKTQLRVPDLHVSQDARQTGIKTGRDVERQPMGCTA